MAMTHDSLPAPQALQRIRSMSRPLTVLLWIAFGLIILVQVPEIVAILFFFHHPDSLRAYVSFTDAGISLTIAGPQTYEPALTPLDTIDFAHRAVLAACAALCAASCAMVLLQFRGLFSLYSRGIIFAQENAVRLKKAGVWFAVAAITINLSGRLFVRVVDVPRIGTSNAAMAIVCGAMIYVIARVMELGREADLERKEFI
jgi:Protein of unknown function (DUF2975)